MLRDELTCQESVLGVARPNGSGSRGHEEERCIERVEPVDRDVGVEQLLKDLGRGGERLAGVPLTPKERTSLLFERVLPPDRVHEDVGVDEDHERPRRVRPSFAGVSPRIEARGRERPPRPGTSPRLPRGARR